MVNVHSCRCIVRAGQPADTTTTIAPVGAATTASVKTIMPPTSVTTTAVCKKWCNAHSQPWSMKCKWSNRCDGCLPCSGECCLVVEISYEASSNASGGVKKLLRLGFDLGSFNVKLICNLTIAATLTAMVFLAGRQHHHACLPAFSQP